MNCSDLLCGSLLKVDEWMLEIDNLAAERASKATLNGS